jgi:hypothetical protein
MLLFNEREPTCVSRRSIKCNKESELTTSDTRQFSILNLLPSHEENGRSVACVNIMSRYCDAHTAAAKEVPRGKQPQTPSTRRTNENQFDYHHSRKLRVVI